MTVLPDGREMEHALRPYTGEEVWWLPDGRLLAEQPPETYCRPHPVVRRKRGEPDPFADLCSMCLDRYFAMPIRLVSP